MADDIALDLARRIAAGGNQVEVTQRWALDVTRDERAVTYVKSASHRGVKLQPAIAEFAKLEGVAVEDIHLETIPDDEPDEPEVPVPRVRASRSKRGGGN